MTDRTDARPRVSVQSIGGPTAILETCGLRLLTDPTFDPPGDHLSGSGSVLTKTAGPALPAERIGPIDVVLLSHDQHADNLDDAGRALLDRAGLVLTTPGGAERLGGAARGLAPWQAIDVPCPDGGTLRVTATPALHGPPSHAHLLVDVAGFVLAADGAPTIYVSGDNASLDVVREIGERLGPIDVAVLFAGAAQTARIPGANLTLGSVEAAEAARILDAATVVPLHFNGWAHFTEGDDDLRRAFADAGLADRLVLLEPGETAVI